MREILFRGKRKDNGEWVEGDLMQHYVHHDDLTIVVGGCVYYEVDGETVSQFTGLTDKNGKEIYEGDMVKYTIDIHYEEIDDISAMVVWSVEDARYMLVNDEEYINEEFDNDTCKNSEVIGNIHDNKDLIE